MAGMASRSRYSEHDLQVACVIALRERMVLYGDIVFVHVPNEGKRSAREGAKLKAEGLTPGAPDLIIWHLPHLGRTVTDIELKVPDGEVSDSQGAFGERLVRIGHHYEVIWAATPEEAVAALLGLLPVPLVAVPAARPPAWLIP